MDRNARKKGIYTLKRRKKQKVTRYQNLLEKIRGRCAVCNKRMVQVGPKKYQCPDMGKHKEAEKEDQEEEVEGA